MPIKMLRNRLLICLACALLAIALGLPASFPQTPAQKPAPKGVPNFGEVTAQLFRGGQPTTEGFRALKDFGIEIVVNFRDEPAEIESERRAVEALGLRYVSISWKASQIPQGAQVAEFLKLLQTSPGKRIFAHCRFGSDRTGVMIATYRLAFEDWQPAQALREMRTYHYHHFFYPQLERYVESLPQQLTTNPALQGLSKKPATPPSSQAAPSSR